MDYCNRKCSMILKRKLRITKSVIRGEEWFRVEQLIPNTVDAWLVLGRPESNEFFTSPVVYSSESGAKNALDRIVNHYQGINTSPNTWPDSKVMLEVDV